LLSLSWVKAKPTHLSDNFLGESMMYLSNSDPNGDSYKNILGSTSRCVDDTVTHQHQEIDGHLSIVETVCVILCSRCCSRSDRCVNPTYQTEGMAIVEEHVADKIHVVDGECAWINLTSYTMSDMPERASPGPHYELSSKQSCRRSQVPVSREIYPHTCSYSEREKVNMISG
jgi:hypothetical protein